MQADKNYAKLYKQNIHALFEKGYAEICLSPPVGITWYLPHFGVVNANKPGKLRIVHDAAAKFQGISLNSLLLPGPDLLQPLLAILMRFREDPIALTADIREMFPQVLIREQDRDSQRFIWRDDPSEPLGLYRMSAMIFGACSSPCTALYVKNLNAKEHEREFPDASHATVYDVYMDDYIASVDNVYKAANLASDIVNLNKKANFLMRDWISNDPQALSHLPSELRSKKLEAVNLGESSVNVSTRVLGLKWQPDRDIISFNYLEDFTVSNVLTKRNALSHLMRIYDPLGLLGPLVSRGRILFQTIWRKGIDWDDQLSQTDQKLWRELFEDLLATSQLQLPRYYSLSGLVQERELHIFSDASELAYAAVCYWRIIFSDGRVKLSLICSKSRVAPLKPISIPRLELQGALLAARLASFVENSHKYKPVKRVFWCDSLNVLAWLRSDARSYKPFVAHRIGEILELSQVKEWRWVPSLHNPADDATRSKRLALYQNSRWVVGPRFLIKSIEEWPSFPSVDMAEKSNLELKSSIPCNLISLELTSMPLSIDPNRLSSYLRLIRATARAHKFVKLLKDKSVQKDLTAEDLRLAEIHVLRHSQLESFPEEINCLKNHRPLPRKSRLFHLSPAFDEHNLLRINGRINRAPDIGEDIKCPIILHHKHPTTKLLLNFYHRKAAHGNHEMVVNEVRQRYWVINLRSAVRSVAFHCPLCRIKRAKPLNPPMGDLPAVRLSHHRRPFTFVGLDYFGPVTVTIGRRTEKRYVALYTCLVIRAIHLEIVHNLSADSALMSLRRFCARRGTPSEIWSDNGTAFVGASRMLRELYGAAITTFAANENIVWKFLPPSAPFMGGVWERLVRSVKTALRVTLHSRSPSEEVFCTLLLEAEGLINSRPLTHVPPDADSQEALTPFHFILGASSGRPIPVAVTDRDLVSRASWRKAVRLLDFFWSRWVREYLPTLNPRRGGGTDTTVKEGDIVLVVDDQLPRGTWPRGRVCKVYFGRDGKIRVADVMTGAGMLKRPSKKLVLL
ncbi:uncharacterized protein LOC123721008 [Papilio machaon]|uniref:uncharacterized protein LOC123721008 n=1 Tax=Papilio machaon TaxID=76193 RepID=UPI001E665B5D|nr:uncharacterized protein LOC123721008 [Papilio machaon]